ncbi:pknH-like extracellular domain protein [Mycobacterium kansasii]|uniref:PknH-like extracellular domain protein n=1 Tax=Mycobacterium kansasii TaxID=1768 RepID=A0A1V3WEL9_MYCKA|nr:pknH-like extracellular domain protein [Mycobacterium kansasii]
MIKTSVAPNSIRLTLAMLCSALVTLVAGCADVVTGTAHPAANLKPHPLTGAVIKDAMLTDTELSQVFDQSFDIDRSPFFGGPAELFWDWPGSKQSDCAGLSHILMGETYTNAQVLNVAHELWWVSHSHPSPVTTVISLEEGVVALPTMAAADALFAKFTQQWQRCVGARIDTGANEYYEVGEVHADSSVVEATVENHDQTINLRESHALGVRNNCIVEVSITYYRDTAPHRAKLPAISPGRC